MSQDTPQQASWSFWNLLGYTTENTNDSTTDNSSANASTTSDTQQSWWQWLTGQQSAATTNTTATTDVSPPNNDTSNTGNETSTSADIESKEGKQERDDSELNVNNSTSDNKKEEDSSNQTSNKGSKQSILALSLQEKKRTRALEHIQKGRPTVNNRRRSTTAAQAKLHLKRRKTMSELPTVQPNKPNHFNNDSIANKGINMFSSTPQPLGLQASTPTTSTTTPKKRFSPAGQMGFGMIDFNAIKLKKAQPK